MTQTIIQILDEVEGALKRMAHAGQMLNQGKPVRDLDEVYGEVNQALAKIPALREGIMDYENVLADKRRLTRELDVAMHGEEGAAKQASLCDLIGPAKAMREQNTRLRAIVEGDQKPDERTNDLLELAWNLSTWAGSINWRGGVNQKEWLDDLRQIIERFQEAYRQYYLHTPKQESVAEPQPTTSDKGEKA